MSTEVRFTVRLEQGAFARGALPKCKWCKADVVWHVTASGKNMPMEWSTRKETAEPGTYQLESHMAYCPQWKNRRRSTT